MRLEEAAPEQLRGAGMPGRLRDALHRAGLPLECGIRGNADLLEHPLMVAVIGTRTPGAASLSAVEMITTALSHTGACIVSGAADGTDMAGHAAAIHAGGPTIACITSGIRHTPLRGWRPLLADADAAHALILAPHAPHQGVTTRTPILRNRLIAAFAHAVIAGEAEVTSGTFHCLRAARELGVPAFVLAPDADAPQERHLLQRSIEAKGVRTFSPEDAMRSSMVDEVLAAARSFARRLERERAGAPSFLAES